MAKSATARLGNKDEPGVAAHKDMLLSHLVGLNTNTFPLHYQPPRYASAPGAKPWTADVILHHRRLRHPCAIKKLEVRNSTNSVEPDPLYNELLEGTSGAASHHALIAFAGRMGPQ